MKNSRNQKPTNKTLDEVDEKTARILLARVKATWPELDQRPRTEITRALNGIENIALDERVEAVTPDRILGIKELFEEVIWADPILSQAPILAPDQE